MQYYKEYGIYRIVSGGSPYCINIYKSLEDAKYALYSIFIAEDERRHRMYYIDNDFHNNKFINMVGVKNFNYYKIVFREYSDWEELSNLNNIKFKNNIIKFKNFA